MPSNPAVPPPSTGRISYQGEPGANSDTAAREMFPQLQPMPCTTFEEALAALQQGEADVAMIPIENSLAGRVADVHLLLPDSGLHIVGEYFLPIHFQLLGVPGTNHSTIRRVRSHTHAFGQCRALFRKHAWIKVVSDDTAGAAREVRDLNDPSVAALAPRLAAELYGLEVIEENVEDAHYNTTRFLALSRDPIEREPGNGPMVSTFVFRIRNVSAALYKALGGFATNGVNMTKLESYQIGGTFFATQFYVDIEGHPQDPNVALALEELQFFSVNLRQLGTYPAHPFREQMAEPAGNRVLRPNPGHESAAPYPGE